jgi:serine/threonine-protein kinase
MAELPRPADSEVAWLLQAVWDLVDRAEHWPAYQTLDRLLYRQHRLDLDAVIARTPITLLLGGRPEGGAAPRPDGRLALTVAGAAACTGSEAVLQVFLATARLAAEAEVNAGVDDDPSVSFAEAAAAVGLPATGEDAAAVARRSGLLLSPEPWTGHLHLHKDGWRVNVDRRARSYAGVIELEAYWHVRERQRRASEPLHVPTVGATVPDEVSHVVELQQRWEVGEQLGSGGFGRVHRATGRDGTVAAIKFVPRRPGADRELLFTDLAGVRNVVPILDSGETDNAWVLVMPLAEGSLADHLAVHAPLPIDDALVVLRDIAAALVDLAGRSPSVVHRDIKPQNVLLLNGSWCLADFGISRYAEASTAPDTQKYALSQPYAAPERWRHERATAAADVYAVGVIAHELVSGVRPFPGPDFRDQHLHASPPPLDGVPLRLAALIDQCLYKSPAARPSPRDLLDRLGRATAGQSSGAAALSSAFRLEAGRAAADGLAASHDRTEEQRRAELAQSASRSLDAVSQQVLDAVRDAAPAEVQRPPGTRWAVQLGPARFSLSDATPVSARPWGSWQPPAFDVVASATLQIRFPPDRYAYEGRSHSLYFCDAQHEGVYAWYETAFMVSPLQGARGRQNPFALNPGEDAAKALWRGMAEYQVAWPFTKLVVGELDEFIDRWLGWFAAAIQGQLQHPAQMPEQPADGSWRRE